MDFVREATAARRTGIAGRWWFAGLGLLLFLTAIAGFVPQAIDNARRGVARPIELHIHAAIMGTLLAIFIAQSLLAGRGAVSTHRRLGLFGAAIGAAAYLSMLVVLDSAMRREDLNKAPFLVQVLTVGIVQSTAFLVLFAAAMLKRAEPAWHRRLITFALLSTMPAAFSRMAWLPPFPLPSYWAQGAWLYVFSLLPVAFDIATMRRLHPATLAGIAVLTLQIAGTAALWQSPGYSSAFLSAWQQHYAN